MLYVLCHMYYGYKKESARKVEGWDEHSKDWIGHFVFQKNCTYAKSINATQDFERKMEDGAIKYKYKVNYSVMGLAMDRNISSTNK